MFEKIYHHGQDWKLLQAGSEFNWIREYDSLQYPRLSENCGLVDYQSGKLLNGYTINIHGFIAFDDKLPRELFAPRFPLKSVASYLADEGIYIFFTSGSIVYNTNTNQAS
jgi:hypothetical protein